MSTFERGIRAGVIGIGRLGREHARIYASLERIASLVLYDQIREKADDVARKCDARVCPSIEGVLDVCEVVSICTPASHHHEAALMAFERGVHVLVEKPIAASSADGEEMVRSAKENRCVLQVGHIERFNGAFQAAAALLSNPLFIESHRLATFTPRGMDVSVVVDLMIHDIDLVLAILKNDLVVDLRASGAGVITPSPDIVNARLEFEGGCVANITASRISREPLRKIRFFQENLYVSVDLMKRNVEAFEKSTDTIPQVLDFDLARFIRQRHIEVDRDEPLRKEILSFLHAVRTGEVPVVSGSEALEALRVAERVLACIERYRRSS